MEIGRLLGLLLVLGVCARAVADEDSTRAEAGRAEAGGQARRCYSAQETRNRIVAEKLADPFVIIRHKMKELHADVISVRLCGIGDILIYEIDFLRPDGRLIHSYFDAVSGKKASMEVLSRKPGETP